MTEPQSNIDEVVLMQRIVNREQIALSELYDIYSSLVYSIAMRILQNKTFAEEATQDTFLKVWDQADRWDASRGDIGAWIHTIARYTAIDRLRKEKRQSPWTAVGLDDLLVFMGKASAVNQDKWYDTQVLNEYLQQLPPEQSHAIELAFFQGMTHQEIAHHLDTPLGTIKSRIRDGLQKLRGWWLQVPE